MTVRVFSPRALREDPAASEIIDAFKHYKSFKDPGRVFGKDAPYIRKELYIQSQLHHVHILDDSLWETYYKHFRSQHERTSDQAVVYCKSSVDPDAYAVIAINTAHAHEQQRDNDLMDIWAKNAMNFQRKIQLEQGNE